MTERRFSVAVALSVQGKQNNAHCMSPEIDPVSAHRSATLLFTMSLELNQSESRAKMEKEMPIRSSTPACSRWAAVQDGNTDSGSASYSTSVKDRLRTEEVIDHQAVPSHTTSREESVLEVVGPMTEEAIAMKREVMDILRKWRDRGRNARPKAKRFANTRERSHNVGTPPPRRPSSSEITPSPALSGVSRSMGSTASYLASDAVSDGSTVDENEKRPSFRDSRGNPILHNDPMIAAFNNYRLRPRDPNRSYAESVESPEPVRRSRGGKRKDRDEGRTVSAVYQWWFFWFFLNEVMERARDCICTR